MALKKCKICNKPFKDKKGLVQHIASKHESQIPEGWTAARFENYLRTGKEHGSCVICKEDTGWNDATEKYCRFCTKESCRTSARKLAEKNLMKAKGITHSQMLSDPEFQRKMVYSKKTSGVYLFDDDTNEVEVRYDSSYGKDFLEMLEYFMGFSACDILGPSPNTYMYEYEGKNHFYIPDFYIPSLHLEVEIKDGGDNPNKHPKIQNVDKVKEALKDEAMKHAKVNYVKVSNKDYTSFFKMLYLLKENSVSPSSNEKSEFSYIVESSGVILDSNESMLQWFYNEINNITSSKDVVTLYAKVEHTEDILRSQLNDDDISDEQRKVIQRNLDELNMVKDDLTARIPKPE